VTHRAILADRGAALSPGARVLDFGCGDGGMVDAYLRADFDAYGCDLIVESETSRLRKIEEPYRLPFDDASFDAVVSDQVLEHVRDHASAAREIARVLRPHGATLHIFPPPWRLREAHTGVPFAGVLKGRLWLNLWALLGVRNPFQQGLPARQVVAVNREFLKTSTNYVGAARLRRAFARHFREVVFCELELLRHGAGRSHRLAPVAERIPAAARVYGTVVLRALLARDPVA
jgi:SAM-dependent methyltransferase